MAADLNKKCKQDDSKVLVFLPPQICVHNPHKKARIYEKAGLRGCWNETRCHFDGEKVVKLPQEGQVKSSFENNESMVSEVSDISSIFIEKFPKAAQESVNSYIDKMFLPNSPLQTISNSSIAGLERPAMSIEEQNVSELQKEYESVYQESQVLLTGVLYSEDSAKKLSNEVDVNCTHPLTNEDVYIQKTSPNMEGTPNMEETPNIDKTPNMEAPSESFDSSLSTNDQSSIQSIYDLPDQPRTLSAEQAKMSPNGLTVNPLEKNISGFGNCNQSKNLSRSCTLPKISNNLCSITDGIRLKGLVNLSVIVIQVNPVKEIQVKSGQFAGQFVPLSSIIVSDCSKSHFKLTLWRKASCWSEKIVPGDIIIATSIRIEIWRDEYIGQTTFNSNFYNLHQPVKPLSKEWLNVISQERLEGLMSWAKDSFSHLFCKPLSTAKVKFTKIADLRNNTLVHFRGVLISVQAELANKSIKNTYVFGSTRLPKITAVFAESPNESISVTVWGRQSEWLRALQKSQGKVYELQYLTAKFDTNSEQIGLHTTPKSTKTMLDPDSELAKPLIGIFAGIPGKVKSFKSIKALLLAKFSGTAEIFGFIDSIRFHTENEAIEVFGSHDIKDLGAQIHRITYIGCASCSLALKQDTNMIYGQCLRCVQRNPGHDYAIKRYFRIIKIRVRDNDRIIDIIVNPKNALKLFSGVKVEHFGAGQTSPENRFFIDLIKERISCEKLQKFVISCHAILDENSFVKEQDFELLDFTRD